MRFSIVQPADHRPRMPVILLSFISLSLVACLLGIECRINATKQPDQARLVAVIIFLGDKCNGCSLPRAFNW